MTPRQLTDLRVHEAIMTVLVHEGIFTDRPDSQFKATRQRQVVDRIIATYKEQEAKNAGPAIS